MATKKATTKPATAMVKWDEELANYATQAAETTATSTGSFIGTASGQFKVGGNPVPGNALDVVVLDHIFENAYYVGAYNPNDIQPPVCFAYGRGKDAQKTMRPDDASTEKQSETCVTCRWNQFGSAITGKGKACGNKRRLALITEDALESAERVEAAEVRYLKVSVTSAKVWDGYVQHNAEVLHKPPFALVTHIGMVPDAKTQFRMEFRLKQPIEDTDLFTALVAKHVRAAEEITFPYQPAQEQPTQQAAATTAARQRAKAPTPATPVKGAAGAGGRRKF